MEISEQVVRSDEKIVFRLRELYRKYGYMRYKMSKFEEYDLYVRNKDFLISDGIITFTDTNGRLLALKPDVTLSIIKNCKDGGVVQKLYYNENVYRVSGRTHDFQEIMQTGLECIGEIDPYNVCEVALLALESLRCTGPDYLLDLAHVGVAAAIAEQAGVPAAQQRELFALLGQKNLHGLVDFCAGLGISATLPCALAALGGGNFAQELMQLEQLCTSDAAKAAFAELAQVVAAVCGAGYAQSLRLDFSIISDMRYYSGVVFKGYLRGVPETVLSGGRYDKLMHRMGKNAGGVGFAVYLDALDRLEAANGGYDIDVLLLYTAQDDPLSVSRMVDALTKGGESVCARREIPAGLRYRRLIQFDGA